MLILHGYAAPLVDDSRCFWKAESLLNKMVWKLMLHWPGSQPDIFTRNVQELWKKNIIASTSSGLVKNGALKNLSFRVILNNWTTILFLS